ncbi:uncharacterized protein N7498_002239 [Penicillium cinerascens]|uniref:Uncharacterized protein n=1 Tax=Penicillium cinerascens TaxID=70096 RepID=A0A9W9N9N6_9EURO|nr:uncharacterized protein N7498_002239 [Penicillium cinerascens]KAJ5215832.1 hypothetical protein N7498_002239 [Penicillium cinerascens]
MAEESLYEDLGEVSSEADFNSKYNEHPPSQSAKPDKDSTDYDSKTEYFQGYA